MSEINIEISEDDAVVLFEFFERFEEKKELYFIHPAEYLSLMKISAQIDKTITTIFEKNYGEILNDARERIAEDFKGEFPSMRKQ
jgi:hypothetical protein